jgi:hypothetical protein
LDRRCFQNRQHLFPLLTVCQQQPSACVRVCVRVRLLCMCLSLSFSLSLSLSGACSHCRHCRYALGHWTSVDLAVIGFIFLTTADAVHGARFPTEISTRGCHWIPLATHVRLKLLHACDQRFSSRKFTLLPVATVNCVATLKAVRMCSCQRVVVFKARAARRSVRSTDDLAPTDDLFVDCALPHMRRFARPQIVVRVLFVPASSVSRLVWQVLVPVLHASRSTLEELHADLVANELHGSNRL